MAWHTTIPFLLLVMAIVSSDSKVQPQKTNRRDSIFIRQIVTAEKQFTDDLNTHEVSAPFEKYATVDAVIKRCNDTVIAGLKVIGKFCSGEDYKTAKAR